MEETIEFYRAVLGFALTVSSPEYSIVERDGQTIHFQKAASEEVMTCVRGHAEIYIEVSGIDALWDHVEAFKNRYRIRDLFDRDYGIIVFHIWRSKRLPGVLYQSPHSEQSPVSSTDH
jgi:hypothetical protein